MRDDRGAMAANDLRVGMIVRVVRGCWNPDGSEDRSWQDERTPMLITAIDLGIVGVKHLGGSLRGCTSTFDTARGWGFRLVTPAECPFVVNECPRKARTNRCPWGY